MNDRVRRWCYRRMAWKNDMYLWCDMHPLLARLINDLYQPSWPIREWLHDMGDAARTKQKVQAIRDVHGDRSIEVKYWKYDGDAADIYAQGKAWGMNVKRNSVKPYSRRELRANDLLRYGFNQEQLEALTDAEVDVAFEAELRKRLAL